MFFVSLFVYLFPHGLGVPQNHTFASLLIWILSLVIWSKLNVALVYFRCQVHLVAEISPM